MRESEKSGAVIRKLGDLQEGEEFTTTLTGRVGYVALPNEGVRYLPTSVTGSAPSGAEANVRVVFEDGEVRGVRAELLVRVD